jgi:hypothetical protein
METLATADQSHLFLGAGNYTLISNRMILERDGGDLSSIRLTRPLLKGSTACGLLLMVLMTHKYRGSQQSSREVLPKFIDSTQGEPKNICKP